VEAGVRVAARAEVSATLDAPMRRLAMIARWMRWAFRIAVAPVGPPGSVLRGLQ